MYTCFSQEFFFFEGSVEVSLVLIGAGPLLVRWSIFSWPEVSLFFCILLERFRGGLCVLFLEFLMSFCLIICGLRGVYAFDPGLYCYLQDLCSF